MADQKAMKKRLKVLMQRPENQVCSDCPEKKPTWASLIVPPPGAPPGTEKIGAFCCLECSGSHRRLGVHISFVRSVNLDAWKEWEVRAMENGGNAKVNAIFEARLAQSGKSKPTNLADGPTRERYIRDKYERRKYYDPAGFSGDYTSSVPVSSSGPTGASSAPRPGAPSEIARQRVASRQARMKPAQSNMYESQPSQPAQAKVAQAPVSAPVVFDLLDFGSDSAPAPSAPTSGNSDPFLATAAPAPSPVVPVAVPTYVSTAGSSSSLPAIPPPQATAQKGTSTSSAPTLAQELMNNLPAATKKQTSNESIMALFGPPQQQSQQLPATGYGMQAMSGMMPGGMNSNNTNGMMMMGGMMPQQSNLNAQSMDSFSGAAAGMTNANSIGGNNSMMQQQQQIMMQNMMMGGNNQMMMMNPQMQQQMMMMMQQQQQRNQPHMQTYGNSSMPGSMGGSNQNNNNFNAMMQGMQNMQVGANNFITRQPSEDGGFGTPMGGNSQQQSNSANDPFSSLGGMNAFR